MFRFTITSFVVLMACCCDAQMAFSQNVSRENGVRNGRDRGGHLFERLSHRRPRLIIAVRRSDRPRDRRSDQPSDRPSDRRSDGLQNGATAAGSKVNENQISLFDGKTLGQWAVSRFGGEGEVVVEDGSILMEFGTNLTGIHYTGDLPTNHYEVSLEAMQVDGIDFFCGLTFPVDENFCSLIVAGWGGSIVGLSNIDDRDASDNETTRFLKFDQGTWYKIRLRVEPDRISAWIDDEQVVDLATKDRRISIRPEVGPSKPFGISAWETRSALRNIRLTYLKEN